MSYICKGQSGKASQENSAHCPRCLRSHQQPWEDIIVKKWHSGLGLLFLPGTSEPVFVWTSGVISLKLDSLQALLPTAPSNSQQLPWLFHMKNWTSQLNDEIKQGTCCLLWPKADTPSAQKAPDVPTTVSSMLSRSRATNTTTSTSCRDFLASFSNCWGAPRTTWNMARLQEWLGREWESEGLLLQVLRKVPWQLWVFCRLYRKRRSLPGPVKLTVQIKSMKGCCCKEQKSLSFLCLSAHFLYNLNKSTSPTTPCRKLCLSEVYVWNYTHCIKQPPQMTSLLVSQLTDISLSSEWCRHHLSCYSLFSSHF